MTISVRWYLLEEGGSLRHVPMRVVSGIYRGTDALPDYAGTTQRAIEVVLENEDGKPVRMLDARGRFWTFDAKGETELDDVNLWFRDLDLPKPRGKVVDLRPQIEKRQRRARRFWDVTAEDLDRLTAVIWPWAGETREPVRAVRSTAPKVPPLPREGQRARDTILSSITDISLAMEHLTETALKGLAYELRRCARLYVSEGPYCEAAGAEAERRREIRARYRTGRGAWYASVRVMHWDEARHEAREIDYVEERCASKDAAIDKARALLAEHAHRFAPDRTVEPEVFSELEWSPLKLKAEDQDD
ncbi:hypothetical protein [Methylobacterium oxalidis]|uniref:Uncharacterized protein n=1 Tax=Methylobacterium oxalidis TaxID=944322 RepID=A0ABQ6DUF2_9HYPH|nr:hypothetical protein [Methylobacterium oxalidis]GJE35347.1 hypothetical protein LDDCCGHA_5565 [Methylobacterium oxalidis]GLS67666.1 hypothetical protein GCM10007888_60510 [Methylobacterium oxalidis]